METLHDVPAAAHAVVTSRGTWQWLPLVPLLASFWVRGPMKIALAALVVLLSFTWAAMTRGYYIAVTDRRILLQRLKRERGKPIGQVIAYPRRNISVRRFRPAKGRVPYAILDLSIQEPSGPRVISLSFYKLIWSKNAEAIKQAIERQGPSLGSDKA